MGRPLQPGVPGALGPLLRLLVSQLVARDLGVAPDPDEGDLEVLLASPVGSLGGPGEAALHGSLPSLQEVSKSAQGVGEEEQRYLGSGAFGEATGQRGCPAETNPDGLHFGVVVVTLAQGDSMELLGDAVAA